MANQESEFEGPSDDDEALEQQNLRLPASGKRFLSKLAEENGMSLPQYCTYVLMEHVSQEKDEVKKLYQADVERAREYEKSVDREMEAVIMFTKSKRTTASEGKKRRTSIKV